jgi:hypothetical protein
MLPTLATRFGAKAQRITIAAIQGTHAGEHPALDHGCEAQIFGVLAPEVDMATRILKVRKGVKLTEATLAIARMVRFRPQRLPELSDMSFASWRMAA